MIYIVSPFENTHTGRGNRNIALLQALKEHDIAVKLISSDWDHGRKQKIASDTSNRTDEILLKVPGYSKNLSFWRIITHWVFAIKLILHLWQSKYQKKNDVIVVNSIPPECILMISLFCRGKVIVDIRDIWPDAGAAYKLFSVQLRLFEFYCKLIYRVSLHDKFQYVVVSRSFAEWLKKFCPKCKPPTFIPLGSRDFRYSDTGIKPKFVYLGGLTPQFDLREFEFLKNEEEVYVIGSGSLGEEFKEYFPRARFTGVLNRDVAMSIASNTDYLLFPSNPYARLPNKIFDYLALNKPIIIGKKVSDDVMQMLGFDSVKAEISGFSVVEPSTRKQYHETDFVTKFLELILKND